MNWMGHIPGYRVCRLSRVPSHPWERGTCRESCHDNGHLDNVCLHMQLIVHRCFHRVNTVKPWCWPCPCGKRSHQCERVGLTFFSIEFLVKFRFRDTQDDGNFTETLIILNGKKSRSE